MRDRSQKTQNLNAVDIHPSSTARLPSVLAEELAGVRAQKIGIQASGASFDVMGPDIDDPVVDEWIRIHRMTHGEQRLDMDKINRNIERLRRQLGPLLRGV